MLHGGRKTWQITEDLDISIGQIQSMYKYMKQQMRLFRIGDTNNTEITNGSLHIWIQDTQREKMRMKH